MCYSNIFKASRVYKARNEGQTPHTLSQKDLAYKQLPSRTTNFTRITINPLTKKILVKLVPHKGKLYIETRENTTQRQKKKGKKVVKC